MGIRPIFDREKSIECILFLSNEEPNTYDLLKLLYFAEKIHLEKYGRLITGDSYAAMPSGPVPSSCYDIIKSALGYKGRASGDHTLGFHVLRDYDVTPEREFNHGYLSESDIECLTEAIERYAALSAKQKKDLSHDEAYEAYFGKPGTNTPIPLDAIARTLPDSEDLLEHLGY